MLPIVDDKLIFVRPKGPELWTAIIEKVWAKIHGSYERIIGGKSYRCLRDLTGAPSFIHEISDEKDTIWDTIYKAD